MLHMILYQARKRQISLVPTRIGKWWHKTHEIDIVIIDDLNKKNTPRRSKMVITNEKTSRKIVCELESKSEKIPYEPKEKILLVAAEKIEDKETLHKQGIHTITLETYKQLAEEVTRGGSRRKS